MYDLHLRIGRSGHSSVALSDDTIVVIGGRGYDGFFNEIWKSHDKGASWILVSSSALSTGGEQSYFVKMFYVSTQNQKFLFDYLISLF